MNEFDYIRPRRRAPGSMSGPAVAWFRPSRRPRRLLALASLWRGRGRLTTTPDHPPSATLAAEPAFPVVCAQRLARAVEPAGRVCRPRRPSPSARNTSTLVPASYARWPYRDRANNSQIGAQNELCARDSATPQRAQSTLAPYEIAQQCARAPCENAQPGTGSTGAAGRLKSCPDRLPVASRDEPAVADYYPPPDPDDAYALAARPVPAVEPAAIVARLDDLEVMRLAPKLHLEPRLAAQLARFEAKAAQARRPDPPTGHTGDGG